MGVHGFDGGQELAGKSSGKFFKLEDDGDKALVVLLGNPFCKEVYWDNSKKTYHDAESPEGEVFKKKNANVDASFRFNMNLLLLASGGDGDTLECDVESARVQVWEQGKTVFNLIVKRKNKFDGLDGKVFEIERNGKAKDQKTTYSISAEEDVEDVDGLTEAVEAAELYDLEALGKEEEDSDDDSSTGSKKKTGKKKTAAKKDTKKETKKESNGKNGDSIAAVRTAIKGLPDARNKLAQFLGDFEIDKIKDLSADRVEAAMTWVSEQSGGAQEVDAFE